MDETIETLMIGVRADTDAFARDAAQMRESLQGSLGAGAEKAGGLIEAGLVRAVRSGKLGFEDLKKTALNVLSDIAGQAVKGGLDALFGRSGGGGVKIPGMPDQKGQDDCCCPSGGGLFSVGETVLHSLLGLPGRATGGPVSPGRAYRVGENGPELFVPTSAGSIAPAGSGAGRDVRVAISIAAPDGSEPQALARSSRQVARAVTRALAQAER